MISKGDIRQNQNGSILIFEDQNAHRLLTSVGLLNLRFRSNLVMESRSSFSKSKSVT